MSHHHDPSAGTQNQGNSLGARSCVRQSKLYRQYESGNDVKHIMGTPHLQWNPNKKEGAYEGEPVFDHNLPHGYRKKSDADRDDSFRSKAPTKKDYEPR